MYNVKEVSEERIAWQQKKRINLSQRENETQRKRESLNTGSPTFTYHFTANQNVQSETKGEPDTQRLGDRKEQGIGIPFDSLTVTSDRSFFISCFPFCYLIERKSCWKAGVKLKTKEKEKRSRKEGRKEKRQFHSTPFLRFDSCPASCKIRIKKVLATNDELLASVLSFPDL